MSGVASKYGPEAIGLSHLAEVHWNPGSLKADIADLSAEPRLADKDRFVVSDSATENKLWWSRFNCPFSRVGLGIAVGRIQAYLQRREVFIQDRLVKVAPEKAVAIRVSTESSSVAEYVDTILPHSPAEEDLQSFVPEFTLVCLPFYKARPEIDGTQSDKFVIFDMGAGLGLLGGSANDTEIKAALFKALSWCLPEENLLPVRGVVGEGDMFLGFDSENVGGNGWMSVWSDSGVAAIGGSKSDPQHPKRLFLAVHDETMPLPALAKLTPTQAAYYFVSGCDQGEFDPAYFGCALARHPGQLAEMLRLKLERYGTKCFLINLAGGKQAESIESARSESTNYEKVASFGFEVAGESSLDEQGKRALIDLYVQNFKRYREGCSEAVIAAGPKEG